MKRKFRKWMFSLCCLSSVFIINNVCIAQNVNVYSIEKSMDTKSIKAISVNSHHVRTEILPSNNNSIRVKLTFEAISEKDGEIEKLKSHIENTLIQANGDVLRITNHGSKRATFDYRENNTKAKLIFDNGRVKLKSLQWKLLQIYVPEKMDIDLHAYFSKVELGFPLKGKLVINAFETQCKAEAFSGNLEISDGQFSKFEFGDLESAVIKINESKFSGKDITDFVIESKFSDVEFGNCSSLKYSGLEDELIGNKVWSANITANFSEIEITLVDTLSVDINEGSLDINTCKEAVVSGKYTKIEIQDIDILKMVNSLETKLKLDNVGEVYSVNGQFNEIEINRLKKTLSINHAVELDLEISHLSKDFKLIQLDGKFVTANLNFPKNCAYTLSLDVQFGDIQLNEHLFTKERYEKDLNTVKMIYHYGENTIKSEVKVKGLEMNIDLSHY